MPSLDSLYKLNPSHCKNCNIVIDYSKRNNIFCSSSCSATFNNKLREKKNKIFTCKNCDKEQAVKKNTLALYCDNKCQQEYQYKERINNWLYNGKSWNEMFIPSWVKRYIIEINGRQCAKCNLTEWQNQAIVLEATHIDGDATNNKLENLELLCPNCHSLTDSYKGKNKGKGRKSRYIKTGSYS